MKTSRICWKTSASLLLVGALLVAPGCGGHDDAFYLEDVGRDLLWSAGVLAFTLLKEGPPGPAGPPGAPGAPGEPGEPGEAPDPVPGEPGEPGLGCWDLNGNGVNDPEEDTNGDGEFNTLDCAGPQGETGNAGPAGPDGEDGEILNDVVAAEFFSIFVDDFFITDGIDILPTPEPALPDDGRIAFRVAIPIMYDGEAQNLVVMRLFFYRTGPQPDGLFIFRVTAARAVDDEPIDFYPNVLFQADPWVGIDLQDAVVWDNTLVVVDLPINNGTDGYGLGYEKDLDAGQFLAFELNETDYNDGGTYMLMGAEFFEVPQGTSVMFPRLIAENGSLDWQTPAALVPDDVPDNCPADPDKTEPGICGCGIADNDTDGDGTLDCFDACPDNAAKTQPEACGCDAVDVDTDGDGTADCIDDCPLNASRIRRGPCGCSATGGDSDGDGVYDCNDACPNDPAKTAPGDCGCGVEELDTDEDGTADCLDGCPDDPGQTEPGDCGCGVLPPDVEILVSTSPDRSDPIALDGTTVTGDVHVFIWPITMVRGVSFFIDGENATLGETSFLDMVGTDPATGDAFPFDTTTLTDGAHELVVTFDGIPCGGSVTIDFAVERETAPAP